MAAARRRVPKAAAKPAAWERMLVGEPDPAGDLRAWVLRANASVAEFHAARRVPCSATAAELRFVGYFADVMECLLWECCDAPTAVATLAGRDAAVATPDVFPDAGFRRELDVDRNCLAKWCVRYNAVVRRVLAPARGPAGRI